MPWLLVVALERPRRTPTQGSALRSSRFARRLLKGLRIGRVWQRAFDFQKIIAVPITASDRVCRLLGRLASPLVRIFGPP